MYLTPTVFYPNREEAILTLATTDENMIRERLCDTVEAQKEIFKCKYHP